MAKTTTGQIHPRHRVDKPNRLPATISVGNLRRNACRLLSCRCILAQTGRGTQIVGVSGCRHPDEIDGGRLPDVTKFVDMTAIDSTAASDSNPAVESKLFETSNAVLSPGSPDANLFELAA